MANIITSCRIICSIMLLFFPVRSLAFFSLYVMAGLTDMIDGTVARKTNTVSEFGSRLDTVADFIFIAACLIKLIPTVDVPLWLWGWIGMIAVIKMINVISGLIVRKKFVTEHTVMNRITGLLLFILPMTISFVDLKYSASAVCAVATFAAIQEGHLIRAGKKLGAINKTDSTEMFRSV